MSKMNETFCYRRETFNNRPTCFKWSQFVFLANPLARPDPQSQPSLTLNLQALIFYHLQALILYPMSRFLAARLPNLQRHCIFGYRSASLVSLYWIVWIADDSIGSLQLDLVHLHYYKDTNSNIVKIKEKRPFSVYSDSEKTSSCNFPIRWTRSMNKKWKPLRTQFDLASV